MTLKAYIMKATENFRDKRVIEKTENFLKKNS